MIGDVMRIGALDVPVPVVLAPMAGVTNAAFRQLCAEQGAGLYVCEMITSRGIVEGDRTSLQMLTFAENETIEHSWGVTASQKRAVVTARSLSWNSAIRAGQSQTFGFIGRQDDAIDHARVPRRACGVVEQRPARQWTNVLTGHTLRPTPGRHDREYVAHLARSDTLAAR